MTGRTTAAGSIAIVFLILGVSAAGCKPKEDTRQPTGPSKVQKAEPAAKPAEETKTETPAAAEGEKAGEEMAAAAGEKEEEKIPEGKEDLVLKIGKPTMPAVNFSHKKHATEYQVACRKCHHPEGEIRACTACHTTKIGPNKEPTFKTAAHKACLGCHQQQKKSPTACNKCHAG
jgi:hypothetical protein